VILVLVLVAASAACQLLALAAAFLHLAKSEPRPSALPPISILKPIRGLDPHFREAIESHAVQVYPEYEILFGVADPSDPAVPEIRKLIEDFPERRIRLVLTSTRAANGKVGTLIDLAKEARYPLLLVNDSDVRVPPDYLRRIVGPLEDPSVGLVTCLYRASSDPWPGRLEAIGIATDFAPTVLVAPLFGVNEFGLGATLLFRAADFRAIGGFEALAGYLADDYQIGLRIARLGRRVVLSKLAVETWLTGRSWGEVWRHQVRWARTIRVSRPGGYLGRVIGNASLWSLVALVSGAWWAALPLFASRILVGIVVGAGVLGSRDVLRRFYWMPFCDLLALAIWFWGLAGDTVEWRGERLRLTRDGRIVNVS
jgi:ceramide glucosyltransferase